MDLIQRWHRTLALEGLVDPANATIFEILTRYSESFRKYHTDQHLAHCFETLDEHFKEVPERAAVELALWYHDFHYALGGVDNEMLSSLAAKAHIDRLGGSEELGEKVRKLVRLTTHKGAPMTYAGRILVDTDLAILGAPDDVFDVYEKQIREEYDVVPEAFFNVERTKVLESFLRRSHIFLTNEMQPFEGQARSNLQRSLYRLEQ